MSLLVATWINTVATVALIIGAGVTAWYAIKAYRDQARQTQLWGEQAMRDIEHRRRAQASRVFVCIEKRAFDGNPDDKRAAACILNTSDQPVYDIALGLGQSPDQRWTVLLPGSEHVRPGLGTAFETGLRPVWVEFLDSAGVRWQATAKGGLTELHAYEPR